MLELLFLANKFQGRLYYVFEQKSVVSHELLGVSNLALENIQSGPAVEQVVEAVFSVELIKGLQDYFHALDSDYFFVLQIDLA